MRIGQVKVDGPSEEVLILPRMQGDIVIRARAVTDMTEFDIMCPEPKAPSIMRRGEGGFSANLDDPAYVQRMAKYNEARFGYICIKSLEPSDIEWEKVDPKKPSTWHLWDQELKEAGLSNVEVNRILVCVLQANSLDENKLKQARDSFVRGLGTVPPVSSGPSTEQPNTQSGEPASDSE